MPTNEQIVDAAVDYVCSVLVDVRQDLKCPDDFQRPILVETWLVTDNYRNVKGVLRGITYRGEPYIFIRPDLDLQQFLDTVLHETAHFVLDNLDPYTTMCASEEFARTVVPTGDEWRKHYGCIKESTDES